MALESVIASLSLLLPLSVKICIPRGKRNRYCRRVRKKAESVKSLFGCVSFSVIASSGRCRFERRFCDVKSVKTTEEPRRRHFNSLTAYLSDGFRPALNRLPKKTLGKYVRSQVNDTDQYGNAIPCGANYRLRRTVSHCEEPVIQGNV